MTDLEMTKLCAEAIGEIPQIASINVYIKANTTSRRLYDPLHDDAQAIALVKKLHLQLHFINSVRGWFVGPPGLEMPLGTSALELNRAIVECVAKLQAVHGA